jgi:hypothetical protein
MIGALVRLFLATASATATAASGDGVPGAVRSRFLYCLNTRRVVPEPAQI